ncbi:uncharacterized protein N7458_009954 [Penicillium daleae]|uniref:Uncharacterized protein n=1 Tax=Penicillium daleae TaxID=63821 RepID=A0AAD6FZL9_9EURO|nr:uncharacterized protein N7458_009954 [Penicillium daleae]KAJ5438956.1 hypothetical protein N7458_009954 [Penicillium daleae]
MFGGLVTALGTRLSGPECSGQRLAHFQIIVNLNTTEIDQGNVRGSAGIHQYFPSLSCSARPGSEMETI